MHEKLLAVQQEIQAIKKDSNNPFFNSNYFDINSLLAQVKPVLNAHKLVLLQELTNIEGKLGITTVLLDSTSGEKMESTCILPDVADAQKAGSAITYFRRYALQSLLALEAVDDDGNVASGKKVAKTEKAPINTDDVPF